MRNNYDKNLNVLHSEMIEMTNLVTNSIEQAIYSLLNKDENLAQKNIDGDKFINDKESEIERLCLNLLLKEQPVASDFRFIMSTLKIITDLERIGDQAADISYLNLKLSHRGYEKLDLGSIVEMSELAVKMIKYVIKAYIDGDISIIDEVDEMEEKVDEYFEKVRLEVVVDVKEDRFTTKNSLDMLMIAKYLERIADHAENISERVYYSITGKFKKG